MKWLKGNLFMTCLAVVAACLAFMSNGNVANAMTLQDLQGTYRVMSSEHLHMLGGFPEGTFVNMVYENGELVGIVKKPGSRSKLEVGRKVIADVFVSDNKITCMWIDSPGGEHPDSVMTTYNHGNTIKVATKDGWLSWTMKRV